MTSNFVDPIAYITDRHPEWVVTDDQRKAAAEKRAATALARAAAAIRDDS